MRASTILALSVALSAPVTLSKYLPQPPPIEYTQVQKLDQTSRTGELSYGASNLDFGYSAGAGINFGNGTHRDPFPSQLANHTGTDLLFFFPRALGVVGGGFNAGIPGRDNDGSLGGGWTVTARNLTFGLGAAFKNVTVDVSIFADKVTGDLSVKINGKEVAL
ncbi:hypothetical protein QTJ16_007142 [Diplocarpon rosae]|uniref:Secreted protein n=1 Tax=Diplocarpon rosae TaxID=946125 RepID=A0AAD9SRZ1_9HELO|nr:hypothetical protein QTJ16_007142 [Diplocarpon rosae]PBP26346.1 hypothetical protein BUE80_DR002603 [Diplocarpon rosae]